MIIQMSCGIWARVAGDGSENKKGGGVRVKSTIRERCVGLREEKVWAKLLRWWRRKESGEQRGAVATILALHVNAMGF